MCLSAGPSSSPLGPEDLLILLPFKFFAGANGLRKEAIEQGDESRRGNPSSRMTSLPRKFILSRE